MPPDKRDDEQDDDATRAIDPDETQVWSEPGGSTDEPTRVMSGTDEPTRRMPMPPADQRPADQEATRRVPVLPVGDPAATRRITGRGGPVGSVAHPTERFVVHDTAPARRAWVVATLIVLSFIGGAAFGYVQRKPSDRNVVARALVGPGGGVMTFDGAGRLTVPTGALPAPTAITIRRDSIDRQVRLGDEGDPRSVTYEPGELVVYAFEPADLRFQQPVTIELPRTGDASAVFVDIAGAPHVVEGQASGSTVKVQTTSFSFDATSAAKNLDGGGP